MRRRARAIARPESVSSSSRRLEPEDGPPELHGSLLPVASSSSTLGKSIFFGLRIDEAQP
jgi:hypothetical protein